MSVAPPNMRVQRTRSSPSALREPLTRHALGGGSRLVGIGAVLSIGLLRATVLSETAAGRDQQVYLSVCRAFVSDPEAAPSGTYFVVQNRSVGTCKDEDGANCVPVRDISAIQQVGKLHASQALIRALSDRNRTPGTIEVPKDPAVLLVPSAEVSKIFANGGWWPDFYQKYPDSRGFAEFSLPAYSADGDEALVYVGLHADGKWGSGRVVRLKLVDGNWKVTEVQYLWLS